MVHVHCICEVDVEDYSASRALIASDIGDGDIYGLFLGCGVWCMYNVTEVDDKNYSASLGVWEQNLNRNRVRARIRLYYWVRPSICVSYQ